MYGGFRRGRDSDIMFNDVVIVEEVWGEGELSIVVVVVVVEGGGGGGGGEVAQRVYAGEGVCVFSAGYGFRVVSLVEGKWGPDHEVGEQEKEGGVHGCF